MKYLLFILAVLGIVVSSLALREHYREYGDSPCSINAHWDCGIVNYSPFAMVGFVFRQDWADRNIGQVNGFLAAAAAAESMLARSDTEWERIRPLMQAQDGALFQSLRRRFLDGITPVSAPEEQQAAAQLFEVLLHTGGPAATGGLEQLPEGVFWQTPYG